jgi:hypothetical protein
MQLLTQHAFPQRSVPEIRVVVTLGERIETTTAPLCVNSNRPNRLMCCQATGEMCLRISIAAVSSAATSQRPFSTYVNGSPRRE